MFSTVKLVLPNAFLLEAAKETLNYAVLFGRVRRDVFLFQLVVVHEFGKCFGSKDQSVV